MQQVNVMDKAYKPSEIFGPGRFYNTWLYML